MSSNWKLFFAPEFRAVPTNVQVCGELASAAPAVRVIVIEPLANASSTDQVMSEDGVVTSSIVEDDVGVVTVNIGAVVSPPAFTSTTDQAQSAEFPPFAKLNCKLVPSPNAEAPAPDESSDPFPALLVACQSMTESAPETVIVFPVLSPTTAIR